MASTTHHLPPTTVKVALLGAGTVGTQVARLLHEQHDVLSARAGANLELVGIAVHDLSKPRDPSIDRSLLTDDPRALICSADIVIELIGGVDIPLQLVRYALEQGKSVVTGNKALLATHGPELYDLAAAQDVDLYYEAAVAGAVPVVYGLRESLAGDQVNTVAGIMNGTTNFILDEMTTKGMDFDEALALAQELGFAEADPSADVDGLDSAAKIAILASLAFHIRVQLSDVHVCGIRDITAEDIASADRAGYVIKLIAAARRREEGIQLTVAPTLVNKKSPLAGVHSSFNAVLIDAQSAGEVMFSGRGAGGAPTASAVLSDVVAAANKKVNGGHAPRELLFGEVPLLDPAQSTSPFYMKIVVDDQPGVLARMTAVFARHSVSISSVRQRQLDMREKLEAGKEFYSHTANSAAAPCGIRADQAPGFVYLTVITHTACQQDIDAVVASLDKVEGVLKVVRVLPVEQDEAIGSTRG